MSAMPAPLPYPAHWEADVVLRDGSTAHLRPVRPEDQDALAAMYAGQSERTIYLRFFTYKSVLSAKELQRFTTVDHVDRVAFVLMLGETMIGIGRYDRTAEPTEAEVAFFISDAYHGRGLGSILLEHLAAAARERGITRFSAEVLPENRKMLNVFSDAGFAVDRVFDDGLVSIHFDIDPTEKSRSVMAAREHRAEAKSVATVLAPQSIAVIGAGRLGQDQAQEWLTGIIEGGYTGALHAVSEDFLEVAGLVPASSVSELPEPVDLAVLCVPIENVVDVVRQCGQAGAHAVLVATSGFADDGERGRRRQQELVQAARVHGMRVVGPASAGLRNTDPAVSLHASPDPVELGRGGLGLFTQSAALTRMLEATVAEQHIGISSSLSAGNRADLSGNDVMQYWEDDPSTLACCLYLESVGNPRKFSRIARRLARSKPVVVATSATAGRHLPAGQTGRTSTAPREVLREMLRQSGVIRATDQQHLVDIGQLLVSQPLPTGHGVAVLTNAFALDRVVADACAEHGVRAVAVGGVLDTKDPESDLVEELRQAVRRALASSEVSALLLAFLPSHGILPSQAVRLLADAAAESGKPVLASFVGGTGPDRMRTGIRRAPRTLHSAGDGTPDRELPGIPVYEHPSQAVSALASVMDWVAWRDREQGQDLQAMVAPEPEEDGVAQLLAQWSPEIPGESLLELDAERTHRLLEAAGIPVLPSRTFTTVEEAVAAAEELGYPVALKSTDPSLKHRLDLGGVRLDVQDEQTLRQDIALMRRRLASYGVQELEIQAMAPTGQNCILRGLEDPLLGPVLSFGMAGDSVNLLEDWAHRIPPLTPQDVESLVREPRASRKLFGYEGLPAVDVEKLTDLVARAAQLKDRCPEIAFLQLNPVMVSAHHLTVLGATVRLGNPQRRTDSARRTMSR